MSRMHARTTVTVFHDKIVAAKVLFDIVAEHNPIFAALVRPCYCGSAICANTQHCRYAAFCQSSGTHRPRNQSPSHQHPESASEITQEHDHSGQSHDVAQSHFSNHRQNEEDHGELHHYHQCVTMIPPNTWIRSCNHQHVHTPLFWDAMHCHVMTNMHRGVLFIERILDLEAIIPIFTQQHLPDSLILLSIREYECIRVGVCVITSFETQTSSFLIVGVFHIDSLPIRNLKIYMLDNLILQF